MKVLSHLYSGLIGRNIDENSEIVVTIGGGEAILSAILAHVNPGDEVILIEPAFDFYAPMTMLAGGVPVFVPLTLCERKERDHQVISSADFVLDLEELESKITARTKMIVINTPHNPLGKVFDRSELDAIGKLCERHDIIMLMDEVYEWQVYEPVQHVRVASLPGLWKRCITVGSAGKTFSVTGWKLGWAYGPEHLIKPMQMIHQNTVYCCPTPIQEAVAAALEQEMRILGTEESYWIILTRELHHKRERMMQSLSAAGMKPIAPDGGYFITANFAAIADHVDMSEEKDEQRDYRFVKWLSKHQQLLGIPLSAFYGPEHKHMCQDLIRFCFFKQNETLDKAQAIIEKLRFMTLKM